MPHAFMPTGRRLHIGGTLRAPGWEVLNAQPGQHVDHVGDAGDLSRFAHDSFDEVYASHVLEHLDPRLALEPTLKEWRRVLRPGGRLCVSVPDLEVLCELFLDRDRLNLNERFTVMLMMFGGHADPYDRHELGFDEPFLVHFLRSAGFVGVRRVRSLQRFEDTSELEFKGRRISLNVIAEKP
jgi:predicted SAM-dependent methyltransferase